ncbi:rhizobiocin secretion protein rspE [Parvularcula bermudensis HTCC2503]|uniref:Membrane fusion protein (MFP) family protein n=1 Tax=Parvularcula bermudensis (strain ATCC BAA-594 / HTCC2503 / KCTC 12087) TaxID=314260 RepID=E0TIE6_PARBH|nr:HlyD family type I secretion periplasmic adaptor subunit [Parvularcula bermudensis]ADM10265.1 rhizobiocin secretion protein rspE [Parvularcula bermudensis HTCC2503]
MSASSLSPSPLSDRSIRISAIVCAVGFGGFFLWSALAKLDEGVTASGVLVVQSDRKQVQHLEGGIIRELHVREGETVVEGDVLVVLEPLQSETARDEIAQEMAANLAAVLRLTALKTGEATPNFSRIDNLAIGQSVRTEIVASQLALFNQQRAAQQARLDLLTQQEATLSGRVRELSNQLAATRRALEAAREDLVLRQQLLEERLETAGNVSAIRREVARLEADYSRLRGEQSEARESIQTVAREKAQTEADFQEGIGGQLVEAQGLYLAARERLSALDDRLARTVVRAPESGIVLNLEYSTVGGVLSPGGMLMEIVPVTDNLVASVRVMPTDRDAVEPGQEVRAKLTAYKSFLVPDLAGEVMKVSADLKQDEATGAVYYEAEVRLDASDVEAKTRFDLLPGMPVETFIASGTSRTFLDYVLEPIFSTFQRGTRMS